MKPLAVLLALTLFAIAPLSAQDAPPAPADSAQAEIRTLRDGLLDAVNKADFDKMLTYLHPRVVITYQNAEVARGREAVKDFQLRMTSGPEKIVENYRADVQDDAIVLLPGGSAAVATGSSSETYKMVRGGDLTLSGRWTATVVKENGQWLVAGLHFSADLFKNPLIASTKKAGVTATIGSVLIGLIAGWLLGRKRVF